MPRAHIGPDVDARVLCASTTTVPVASVLIVVPPDAMPGDVYDGVVTVTATDGSFPTGTVKVHAVVAAPTFTVTPEVVEFGDVAAGKNAQRNVTFTQQPAYSAGSGPSARGLSAERAFWHAHVL